MNSKEDYNNKKKVKKYVCVNYNINVKVIIIIIII